MKPMQTVQNRLLEIKGITVEIDLVRIIYDTPG